MKRVLMFAVVPMLLLSAACGKAPTEKMTAAEKAVNDARTAGAPKYAPEDFAKLESTLTSAKNEIAEQDAKFGFLRDYEKAEQVLTTAQTEATRVSACGVLSRIMNAPTVLPKSAATSATGRTLFCRFRFILVGLLLHVVVGT